MSERIEIRKRYVTRPTEHQAILLLDWACTCRLHMLAGMADAGTRVIRWDRPPQ